VIAPPAAEIPPPTANSVIAPNTAISQSRADPTVNSISPNTAAQHQPVSGDCKKKAAPTVISPSTVTSLNPTVISLDTAAEHTTARPTLEETKNELTETAPNY
jgi:hypothetical protein